MEKHLLAFCSAPDAAVATRIGEALVARGAAACVKILSPCRSIYVWQGAVERASESPMLIKTTAAKLEAARRVVEELHPYDCPEFFAVPICGGAPEFLRWIENQCGG